MKIYLLQHSYEYEVCEGIKTEETKIIGIYSSELKAENAKAMFSTKKGFDRFPEDCFYVDEYQLDQNHWIDGFVTWDSERSTWIE